MVDVAKVKMFGMNVGSFRWDLRRSSRNDRCKISIHAIRHLTS